MVLVLSDEERKIYKKEYRDRPENKAKEKEYRDRPEVKAKVKERRSRPKNKARKKESQSTPEYKAIQKEYRDRLENKAREKERQLVPEYKESERKRKKELQSRPESKAYQKEYNARPEVIAKRNSKRDSERLKVLQYYSKRLSKSNIPCCRCCGENFHIDFLAVDHIAGMKKMDFEPELVKSGYSSTMGTNNLMHWIIVNNFPTGFQILCHKCNFAKGIVRNNNKCPHQK